jgi:hypothetical protein
VSLFVALVVISVIGDPPFKEEKHEISCFSRFSRSPVWM